jgi:alpha-D-xyloside xylohydrolase
LRWLPFGVLLSHARCHGLPPTEPWEFDDEFMDVFRKTVELRYRLLPYLWTQAHECSEAGHPMIRPLFFEFTDDPGSWQADDVYLLGDSLLVAPLFEEVRSRPVYLPPGQWVDVQNQQSYEGGRWVHIEAGEIPAIILARGGKLIPTAPVAQHTGAIDWNALEIWAVGAGSSAASGAVRLADGSSQALQLKAGKLSIGGKANGTWSVRTLGKAD